MSPQHYSYIETGGAKVSLPALIRLCNALGVTPDNILMDSVVQATPIYLKDVSSMFADCGSDEMFLMLSQAQNLKTTLRTNGISSKE